VPQGEARSFPIGLDSIVMSHEPTYAIEAHHLGRTFEANRRLFRRGETITAVEDVSLAVEPGIIYGLLGPNGAGKTTTIKMLSTLLVPSTGQALVAGYDVATQEREVRRRLGVVLGGDRGLYGKLTARDNLTYFGHLYGMPRHVIPRRVDEMLDMVDLGQRADHRVEGFSRGMKQRVHLAKALLHNPPVIFLDEPSIGLDPAAAVAIRKVIARLVPEHTVLLTTHYLHEADELCSRIAIIDNGRILVEDTPAGIKRRVDGEQRYVVRVRGSQNGVVSEDLRRLPSVRAVETQLTGVNETTFTLRCDAHGSILDEAVRALQARGVRIESIQAVDPTLEDAFLALTNGAA
jgi:ABC-2 type transport system ATP-binding protein